MSRRFERMAAVLRAFAQTERESARLRASDPGNYGHPHEGACEACGGPCQRGGLCAECIDLAAGACMFRAKGVA